MVVRVLCQPFRLGGSVGFNVRFLATTPSLSTIREPKPRKFKAHPDNVSDMVNRIQNAYLARLPNTIVPNSNTVQCILKLFEEEGFIRGFETVRTHVNHPTNFGMTPSRPLSLLDEDTTGLLPLSSVDARVYFNVLLKYHLGKPVITRMKRISKPGWPVQMYTKDISRFGAPGSYYILRTKQGDILTDKFCRKNHLNLLVEVLMMVM
eukprot:Rmarinus@m.12776